MSLQDDLDACQESISTRADFVRFMNFLLRSLREEPDAWENPTLDRYLDALSSLVSSLDQLYINRGEQLPEQPTWKIVAEILHNAQIYE